MASLELFARGQSPALGCALPQEDYAARSLLMGPVVPVKDFQADGMKQHVNSLLGVLRAHYVFLPCERVLAFLTTCQQQQQGLLPGCSSTSNNLGASSSSKGRTTETASSSAISAASSSSSCSSSNSSSANRHSTSGSRGIADASNAAGAAAAPGGGGSGGGRPLGAGGSSPVSALADALSLSKQDMDDAIRIANHVKTPGVLWLMLQPPRRCSMTVSQEHANSSSSSKGQQQQQQKNSEVLHAGNGASFTTSQGSSSTAGGAMEQASAAGEGMLGCHEAECAGAGREGVAIALEQLQLLLQLLFIAWPSTARGGKAAAGAALGGTAARAAGGARATAGAAPGGAGAATAGAVPGAGETAATAAAGTATAKSAEDKVGMAGTAGGEGREGPRGATPAGRRDGQTPGPAGQQTIKELAILDYEQSGWGLLLLLAAVLQEVPVEVKLQLMQQQEGTLLLQLLYRVLLDQDKMEKEDCRDSAPLHLVDMPVLDVLNVLTGRSIPRDMRAASAPELFSVVQLVLMVLQGLLLVATDPWGPEGKEGQLLKQTVGVLWKEGELQD